MWRVVIFFWKAVDRFFRFQWRFLGSEATRVIFCWKAADRCQSRVKVNRLLCSLAWAASRVEKWMLSTEEQYICIFCSNFYTFFKLLHNVLLTLLHTVLFKLFARSAHFCVPSRGHRQLSRPRPWPRKRMISHTDKSSGVVNSESLSNIFLKRMILHTQDTICHRCHRQMWYFVKYPPKKIISHTQISAMSASLSSISKRI